LSKAGFHASLLGPKVDIAPATDKAYHPRVYAISVASQQFLAQLGVWDLLDSQRITPGESMEIYGDADGKLSLHAWQTATTTLAWIIESGELERVLQQAVKVFGLVWHQEKFERLENLNVFTDTGRAISADLLVGADGAKSAVRTAAGISHQCDPYGDNRVVVHLNAELAHQNIALQWFTGDSVLALLPMPDTPDGHQVSMVWSMPEAIACQLQAMPEQLRAAELERRLAVTTGGRLGRLSVRSAIFSFPLTLERSGMVAPGIALVGDAAHRVHPLAGQGLNLGLGDVKELLDVLTTKEAYRTVGDLRVLRRYRRARAEPILAMRIATHGLHRLFATRFAPAVWARNVGMQGVDRLPFIKRLLIDGAAGR
ncbi:FAD-dependent monooxygenase, partial [Photobacterium phosphoreum]|uniref:FAD-dependent monooxygenase n=1 Tax=Photobacterium phosphoreum TaxID=659 RepID=UPI001E2C3AC1